MKDSKGWPMFQLWLDDKEIQMVSTALAFYRDNHPTATSDLVQPVLKKIEDSVKL